MRIGLLALLLLAVLGCSEQDAGASGNAPSEEKTRTGETLVLPGDAGRGKTLYADHCATGCHLDDGTGKTNGGTGKDLTAWLPSKDNAALINAILEGRRPGMPGFAKVLSDQQIADLVAYTRSAFGG
jgi:mono/diheme cytochrome c family protein